MADIPPLDPTPCADCGCPNSAHQIGKPHYCGRCVGCHGFIPVPPIGQRPAEPPPLFPERAWREVPVGHVTQGMIVANYGPVIHARHCAVYSYLRIETASGESARNYLPTERLVVAQADAR